MKHTVKKMDGGQLEITVTVDSKEQEPHLKKAATFLAEKKQIKGFRKGKAPYELVKREFGEMGILQQALETIVQSTFIEVIKSENLDTVGTPKIEVEQVAPGNDFVYKATVALLPNVKLADLKKIKITTKAKKITDANITEVLDSLRGMKANEVVTDKAATDQDKLVIDMLMSIDKVPVEGGTSKDYQVYLSEKHYIPGFNKELVGLKKGEKKEFTLDFPKDHYQKMLAGKKVEFAVTIKEVFVRELPKLDDEFAKVLGQKDLDGLKKIIRENKENEEKQKTEQKQEIEMLDQLTSKSKFDEIPEVIVAHEKEKVFYELKNSLEKNGVTIKQYLEDIKKTEEDLLKDFTEQATKRAKAALISRHVAKEQPELSATKEEIDTEIEKIKIQYAQSENKPDFDRADIRETIATSIQNRKVIVWLKEQVMSK